MCSALGTPSLSNPRVLLHCVLLLQRCLLSYDRLFIVSVHSLGREQCLPTCALCLVDVVVLHPQIKRVARRCGWSHGSREQIGFLNSSRLIARTRTLSWLHGYTWLHAVMQHALLHNQESSRALQNSPKPSAVIAPYLGHSSTRKRLSQHAPRSIVCSRDPGPRTRRKAHPLDTGLA